MIHYLVTRRHAYTLQKFLDGWGRALAGSVRILFYEQLGRRRLPPGTYIFSDLERLDAAATRRAARIREKLRLRGGGYRLLNDPARSLRRRALLDRLHARGHNAFRVFGIDDPLDEVRLPAFLRGGNDHAGAATSLLTTRAQVEAAMRNRKANGWIFEEFCDTSDARGIYRKYSAFRIGGTIIARHLFFSFHWMVKLADLALPELLKEELDYVRSNPHAARLEALFDIAGIDYGRIDYALLEGRPQVWEINTNPCIASSSPEAADPRRPVQAHATQRILAAYRDLEEP